MGGCCLKEEFAKTGDADGDANLEKKGEGRLIHSFVHFKNDRPNVVVTNRAGDNKDDDDIPACFWFGLFIHFYYSPIRFDAYHRQFVYLIMHLSVSYLFFSSSGHADMSK